MISFESLAERYPALYLKPGASLEEYRQAAGKGKSPEKKDLSHFMGSELDEVLLESTPVGDVEVLFLKNRQDFETLLQLLAYRARKQEIPRSTGAMTLDGLINWKKINDHKQLYYENGGLDWAQEFRIFTSNPENYRDTLILLSDGPYSSLPAYQLGFEEEQWRAYSRSIRHFHELTHVIARKKYPDRIHPLFDEVIADAIGLIQTFGDYDLQLAARFLGISSQGYTGGRLENYTEKKDQKSLDELARKMFLLCEQVQTLMNENREKSWLELIDLLEENQSDLIAASELSPV